MKIAASHHIGALGLPFGVLIVFPSLLLLVTGDYSLPWTSGQLIDSLVRLLGLSLVFIGATLLFTCIRMFSRIGEGTLAPWAPPKKLVVEGLYRYTRSPMILGVIIVGFGESMFFSSLALLILFLFFWALNHIYFIVSEEPGLLARFGQEFQTYKENVPRWIPRRTPWYPDAESEGN
jgi:protein-S-isoprenylcysteine O-methyltransferase Ste14